MLVYDAILENADDEEAVEYARGMVWDEVDSREQLIPHRRRVETVDDVAVYYDYGADYYFFVDESKRLTAGL